MKTTNGELFVVWSYGEGELKDLYSFKLDGREMYNARLVAEEYGINADNSFSALTMMSRNQKKFVKTGPTVRKLGLNPAEFNGGVDGGGDWFISKSGTYDLI